MFLIGKAYNGNLTHFVEKAPFGHICFSENREFGFRTQLDIDYRPRIAYNNK